MSESLLHRRRMMASAGWKSKWLTEATVSNITALFGNSDGITIAKATDVLLDSYDPTYAQQLANYINNDYQLVCSIGLQPSGITMPERQIQEQSGGTYTLPSMKTNSSTIVKANITFTGTSGSYPAIGGVDSSDQKDWRAFYLNGTIYWDCGSSRMRVTASLNTRYELELGNNYITLDGVTTSGATQSASAIYQNRMFLGGPSIFHNVVEIFDGTVWHKVVPSIQNGVNGMIDLYSLTFLQTKGMSYIPDVVY